MTKLIFLCICTFISIVSSAQAVSQNIQKAFKEFETDPQLKYAISSLYVIDANTGKVVFDKNSQVGLAPASTQKIITAATAFELLGKDYRYKTTFSKLRNLHSVRDELQITGGFDPTLGSERLSSSNPSNIFNSLLDKLHKSNIRKFGRIIVPQYSSNNNPLPEGYIWNDIGNYYGAGAFSLNWRENQYDMVLRSDKLRVDIVETIPAQKDITFFNFLSVGAPGSGDNAYIYTVPFFNEITVRGTIPPSQNRFTIAGSMINPARSFSEELYQFLVSNAISFADTFTIDNSLKVFKDSFLVQRDITDISDLLKHNGLYNSEVVHTHYSPSLDSIIYWFLQKSINLYGEALIKTFSYEKNGFGSTDGGIKIVKDFWKQKGIDEDELNIGDGSGLSPGNRVTTHAQVEILKYAKKRPWFSYFYNALPEYNGMKMKSGTIKNVKGFCGYHKAANGKEYIFSFLVNNYNGSSSELVGKMYRVLNQLK